MDTIQTLKQMIHDDFGIDSQVIADDVPLTDYEIDSLSLAEFVFCIEDSFHVDFPNDLSDLKTLADVARMVDALPRNTVPASDAC